MADDQALVRANRCFVLEQQPGITVVGEAGDGFYAAELALQRRPDVVLKDIQMPGVDGLKAAR